MVCLWTGEGVSGECVDWRGCVWRGCVCVDYEV